MANTQWLDIAKTLQSIAQAGLTYAENKYDIERYEQIQTLAVQIISDFTDTDMDKVIELFTNETGYQTPKVDVRGVIFKDEKILMIRESIDGRWSLPGGWADLGYTPGEIVVKEVREEAGLDVEPVKLLAVLDKKCHPHPPSPYHVYKMFIRCDIVGGQISTGMETIDVGYFAKDALPELSVERNTKSQIELMFEFLEQPEKTVVFD